MRFENTWQEIRDHSFIQNHSRSFRFTAQWRFFSSVHLTHLLQGSGQRSGMVIAEACFCAQWPICVFVFQVCVWIIVRLEESVTFLYFISWSNFIFYQFYQFIILSYSYIHSYSYKGADIFGRDCKKWIYIINLTKFELSLCLKQDLVYCKTGLKYWLKNFFFLSMWSVLFVSKTGTVIEQIYYLKVMLYAGLTKCSIYIE